MDLLKIKEIVNSSKSFSGAIQIVEKGTATLNMAKGYARMENETLIDEDTLFGIASGTKGFTALGILKLIDQKKLSLDDDVFKILPQEFPNVKDVVTVRHLLCHTSGIFDYFDEDVVEDFGQLFDIVPITKILGLSDMMPLLVGGESYFKPGEKCKYCNSGYVILGILIETISKMSYSDYLDKHVIKPLGLKRTGCYRTNQLPKNTAIGYMKDDKGAWMSNIFDIPMACTADGGLFTTVGDIAKMWDGLLKGDFLSTELKSEALKVHVDMWGNNRYGLGFYMEIDDKGKLLNYHLEGGDPGVEFYTYYFIESDTILTIESNVSDGAWKLLKDIKGFFR